MSRCLLLRVLCHFTVFARLVWDRSKCSPSSFFRVICAFISFRVIFAFASFRVWDMTHSYVFRVIFAFVSLNEEWFVPHSEWLSTVQFRVICTFTSSRVIWSHSIYTHINYTCTFFSVHFAGDTHWLSPYICIYIYTYLKSREHILITTQNNAFNLTIICMYISSRTFPWRNEENTFSLLLKTTHSTYWWCIYTFILRISPAKWREHILITTQNNAFNLMIMHIYFSSYAFRRRNEMYI